MNLLSVNRPNSIEDILGRYVGCVCFVMDYVELRIDGGILRFMVDFQIFHERKSWTFPQPGSEEAVCGLIGRQIVAMDLCDSDHIRIEFTGEYTIEASLDPEKNPEPESMHFVPAERTLGLQVW